MPFCKRQQFALKKLNQKHPSRSSSLAFAPPPPPSLFTVASPSSLPFLAVPPNRDAASHLLSRHAQNKLTNFLLSSFYISSVTNELARPKSPPPPFLPSAAAVLAMHTHHTLRSPAHTRSLIHSANGNSRPSFPALLELFTRTPTGPWRLREQRIIIIMPCRFFFLLVRPKRQCALPTH